MDIFQLIDQLNQSLAGLKGQIEDLQIKASQAQAEVEIAKAAAKKEGYDEGFAAGVASVPPGDGSGNGDKVYSQAEVDQMLEGLKNDVSVKESQITSMQGEIDSLKNDVQGKIDSAIAALKADLKAKYQAQQEQEGSTESGFGSMLD